MIMRTELVSYVNQHALEDSLRNTMRKPAVVMDLISRVVQYQDGLTSALCLVGNVQQVDAIYCEVNLPKLN